MRLFVPRQRSSPMTIAGGSPMSHVPHPRPRARDMPAGGYAVGIPAAGGPIGLHRASLWRRKGTPEPVLWERGLGQRPPGKLLPGHDRIIPLLPLPRFRVDGGSFNACHAHGVSAVPAVREDVGYKYTIGPVRTMILGTAGARPPHLVGLIRLLPAPTACSAPLAAKW